MKEQKSAWYQWMNLVISEPYYVYHFIIFFSYLIVRTSAIQIFSSDFSYLLLRREIQAVLALLMLVTVKLVKEESWEGFISDVLFFSKGFLIVVSMLIDIQLALCYMVVFFVVFTLTQEPPYSELGHATRLTPLQLEVILTEGSASRFWLVEFRALTSSNCIRTSRFVSDLSITYSTKNLSFGIVDLGLFPNAAEKYGISMGEIPVPSF
ncbi:thioredoxin-related transmembrane protein 2-like isoform X2 [Papaver somniferum]|uniref:thioredoxin-related transmembrane protein 2-like isoform X2 n=1 Tax=Papaver somniferum TaxID=3469 RepID=UPI000E6FCDBD|nr:thioredoxin-related transmembrane protein 2-like isoform X2 [Papaver somniferum]